ncbi:MAG TPA: hypothetical protein VJO14_03695 [Bacteroidota bacterium]|nr:hypothetical protein [Bacteroidota bacterium]
MSTGRVMPGGQYSFAVFEMVVLQGGYGIGDIFQVNATGTFGYGSVGTKLQAVHPSGLFGGLAVGADLGYYPRTSRFSLAKNGIWTINAAASVGNDDIMFHLNVMQIYQADGSHSPDSYLQAGCSLTLQRTGALRNQLMGELWMREVNYPSPHFIMMVIPVGFRHAS